MENKNLLIGVVLGIIIVAIAFTIFSNPTPPKTSANITADWGDMVTVDYTLVVDGKVVETSISSVAAQNNITIQGASYSPLTFKLLYGGSLISGFVKGIVGMKVGEQRTFNATPEEAYGPYNYSLAKPIDRYYNMSLKEEKVPRAFFEKTYGYNLWEDRVIRTASGYDIVLTNLTNTTLTVEYMFKINDSFTINGLPQKVVNITNTTASIRIDPVENATYMITPEKSNTAVSAIIRKVTDQKFIIDYNHKYAGRNLQFTITLNSVIRPSAS